MKLRWFTGLPYLNENLASSLEELPRAHCNYFNGMIGACQRRVRGPEERRGSEAGLPEQPFTDARTT